MNPVRSRMTLRATVERATQSTDAWGQPGVPTWSVHLTQLPCYTWASAGREVIDGGKTLVLTDRKVLLPLGTDVTEGDRIVSIADRKGAKVVSTVLHIRAVLLRESHLELTVEEVQ